MVKFKITYWLNSNINITYVYAPDRQTALVIFYTHYAYDDVIEVKELVE